MQTPALLCILKGPEYIYELANPHYREFIGNSDPIGKKLIDIIPTMGEQGFLKILDKVYTSGVPFNGLEMSLSIEKTKGQPEQKFVNLNYQLLKNDHAT